MPPNGRSPRRLNDEKRAGDFRCAGCGTLLYTSDTKYNSGSGWPSFYAAEPGAVATTTDTSHGMTRTEVHCATCEGHLGHIFPDGPRPTGHAPLHQRPGAGLRAEGGLRASGGQDPGPLLPPAHPAILWP